MKFVTTPALRVALSLMAMLILSACASSPPTPVVDFKQDYDFSNVRTIAFLENSGGVSGDNPLQLSDMQRNRVDDALSQALFIKGSDVIEDADKADLLISWHLVTQHKTDVRTHQSASMGYGGGYGGYGRYGGYNRYSMYNCWSCMPTQTEVTVKDYTEGTFIVDLIDPKLRQSVWRGKIQSKLKADPDEDQEKYNAAAIRMFANFPPILMP